MTDQKPYSRALFAIVILMVLIAVGLQFGVGLTVDSTPTTTPVTVMPTQTLALTVTPTIELTPLPVPTVENAGGFQNQETNNPSSNSDSLLKQIWDWLGNSVWPRVLGILAFVALIATIFGPVDKKSLVSRFQRPKWQRIKAAREGEILVIVTDFERRGVQTIESKTMVEQLQMSINAAVNDPLLKDLPFRIEHTSEVVANSETARKISDSKNATIVIWGSIANSILTNYYEVSPRWGYAVETPIQKTNFNAQLSTSLPLLDQVTYRFENAIDQRYVTTFTLAQLLYSNKKYDAATPLFESALKLISTETFEVQQERGAAAAWFYIGNIRQDIVHELVSAEEAYSNAIGLNRQLSSAYYNRGLARYRQGKLLDEVINDFTQAILLKPQNPKAYNNRGQVYSDQNKLDEAISDFTQAILLKLQNANAYYNRGIAYFKQSKLDEAISDFTQVILLNPNDDAVHFNRGVAYFSQNKLDEAISDFTQAILLNPNNANAYNNRGLAYYRQGTLDNAISDFSLCISISPQLANPYVGLGVVLDLQHKYAEALRNYQHYLEITGDNADAYFVKRVKELDAILKTATPTPSK